MKTIFALLLLGVFVTGAYAQRPRTMDPDPAAQTPAPARKAPKTVKAKYEGGVFGYNKTMDGTLTFDDDNNRLLFKDNKPPKEITLPYEAITSAFADTKKVQPAAATVASNVPSIYSLPGKFIKTKVRYLTIQYSDPDSKVQIADLRLNELRRYLTIQYSDPDSKVQGITSFKISDKELLQSVLAAVAEKANLTLRGDVYVKKKSDVSSQVSPN